jgi:translocation and assembly module TamA
MLRRSVLVAVNIALLNAAMAWISSPGALAQSSQPAVDESTPIRFRVVVNAPRPYEKLFEGGLDLVRWQDAERVTLPLLERLVAEARKSAAEALAADGYFSAEIETSIEKVSLSDVVVRLNVELGPRTRVREVDLRFSGVAVEDAEGRKRINAVRQGWSLSTGEPFQQQAWDAAKNGALARLSRGRYAAAAITDSQARIDPEAQSAALSVQLDSGPIFHAGPTHATGLKRYPESIVRNMNPFSPGEPYDGLKLDLMQRRLLETGYFNAVQLAVEPDPKLAAAAPLNVSVVEAPSQRIETGVAYNTDTGPGLNLDYSNADVFDSAWRFRSLLRLNARDQNARFTFDTPPRPGGVWDTYTTSFARSDIENLLSREAVIGYAYNWGLLRLPSQLGISAHLERRSVPGFDTENNHAVFIGYRKTFTTAEELVSPREGLIGTLEAGVGVPGLSSRTFVRTRAHVNWLIPLGLRNDLLLRAEAGMVFANSRSGIPTSFLFRTGGNESIRGYDYLSLGVPQGSAIVGGRYLALASIEYTRWVTDSLGAAVFVDGGDAFDQFNGFELAMGYGVGVRWRSPVGPLRADVAYGERAKSVRVHFSVGYSF